VVEALLEDHSYEGVEMDHDAQAQLEEDPVTYLTEKRKDLSGVPPFLSF